jgi:uncharacterized protein (TIGR00299 family) protein
VFIIKTLYFEPFSGISGDMALGAMLDLGIDQTEFLKRLDLLSMKEFEISISKSVKRGITGTKVVIKPDHTSDGNEEHEHNDCNHHEHSYDNIGHHKHHDEKLLHCTGSHVHRSYIDIRDIIQKSRISDEAKLLSLTVFERLAIAEGNIHGVPTEDVTFHEVGAIDSIVDLVGFAICLDLIGAERIYVSSVNVGGGMVKSRHGLLPVPAPATLELLKGIPIYSKAMHGELTTPTGAAILAAFCEVSECFPAMSVEKIGYGLGSRDYEFPNCLRVSLGKSEHTVSRADEVSIIESNIDDMGGEFFGFLMEKLLQKKALDVWFTPIYMKKNRPAVKLSVMCKKRDIKELSEIVLRETTTIGVRSYSVERTVLERNFVKVITKYGEVTLKVSSGSGVFAKVVPEYEDCRKLAIKADVPLIEVYETAIKEYGKTV